MESDGVLVLDDDEDVLDAVGLLLKTCSGRRSVAVRSVAELRAAGERALGCAAAILDINLGVGAPNGLDALAWLREKGFVGKIVLLTGHADNHPLVARALALGGVQVLRKPIEVDDLLRAIADSPGR